MERKLSSGAPARVIPNEASEATTALPGQAPPSRDKDDRHGSGADCNSNSSLLAGGLSADNCLLFFGCRRRDQDYLYGDLLEHWHRDRLITLHTAFSRQQVWLLVIACTFLCSL